MFKNKNHYSPKLIYKMYFDRVYLASYFIIQDRELARDVTQDTFIKAFKQIHTIQDFDKLGAWLSTIASRTAIDYLRKIKAWRDTEDALINHERSNKNYFVSEVESIIENKDLRNILLQELERLSTDHKHVLLLRYIQDLTLDEIAKTLDISNAAVKTRLFRARLQLRNKLKQRPDIVD